MVATFLALALTCGIDPVDGLANGAAEASRPAIHLPPQVPQVYGGAPVASCGWPTTLAVSRCSAILIHPEIAVYAAHCGIVDRVALGDDIFNLTRMIPATCHLNPDSDLNWGPEDFAYCRLSEPITDVEPTPPAMGCEVDQLEAGDEVTVVGFGVYDDNTTGIKREVVTTIQEIDREGGYLITGGGGDTACSGDSGGPTYAQATDGSWRVVGIHSGRLGECDMGVGYDVLITQAIPWIESHSGVDVTPCTDAAGSWQPGPQCQGFATDPAAGGGTWDSGCALGAIHGPGQTCGPAWSTPPEAQPPSVTWITPTTDLAFPDADHAELEIEVTANDGTGWGVVDVWLRINGNDQPPHGQAPRAGSEGPPRSWQFPQVVFPPGTHEVVAVASDFYDNLGQSQPIVIRVGADANHQGSGPDGTGGSGTDTGGAPPSDDRGCRMLGNPAKVWWTPLAAMAWGLGWLAIRIRRPHRK